MVYIIKHRPFVYFGGGAKLREWLANYRVEKGLTKKQLAETVQLDISAIGKYERGERRPSPEKAKVIAETLGFDWTKFFDQSTKSSE